MRTLKGKGAFLWLVMLAAALVLLLIPMQEAKALQDGDLCPDCGTGILILMGGSGSSQHYFTCNNRNCIHASYSNRLYEDHYGGEATCTSGPICEGCMQEYGWTDPYNHDWSVWQDNGYGGHNRYCQREGCSAEEDGGGHSGGTNTCTKGAICEYCGAEYDDSLGHLWGAWIDDGDGANHTHACNRGGCDETETAPHSGGTNTCTEGAICEYCGAEYGNSLGGHVWGAWTPDPDDVASHYRVCQRVGCDARDTEAHHVDEIQDASPTFHNYVCNVCNPEGLAYRFESHTFGDWKDNRDGTHSRTCASCGRMETVEHTYTWTYVDNDTCKGVCVCGVEVTEAHYDRWASACGRQPHCEKCDHDYGTIPEHEMWYQNFGESGHQPNCYHCDTYFFLEPHSGGTATCVKRPICEKCNAEYDEPDLNNHDWGEWTCDPSDMVNHYRVCKRSGCGVKQTEAHHADTFGKDTDGHYYICLVCNPEGFAYRFESHTFGDWKDNRDGTHSRTCAPCGRMETVEHSGGAATCTEAAKCEACGVAYGKPLGHDRIDHEAKAPTCTEIGWDAYQTCSRCDYTTYKEKPALGHSGATGAGIAPTCTEPGLTEETYCLRCGQTLFSQAVIPALGHDYVVSSRTITRIYYQCSRCKKSYWTDNGRSRNLLPDLVWNDRDESIGYTAGVAAAGGVKTLTVTPDAEAAAASAWVSLRLRPDDVEQWKREGIGAVAFQCGSARLEITLSALTPDWFHLTAPLDRYVFTLAPEQEGTLVTVEAQTGAEKTPAEGYSGITLVLDGAAQEIGQNGIY